MLLALLAADEVEDPGLLTPRLLVLFKLAFNIGVSAAEFACALTRESGKADGNHSPFLCIDAVADLMGLGLLEEVDDLRERGADFFSSILSLCLLIALLIARPSHLALLRVRV